MNLKLGTTVTCTTTTTRRTTKVQRDIEARPCKHLCFGKAQSIRYCECVFVALCVQHATRMHRIVIRGLSVSTTILRIFS
jgi:hypothetical protein